MHKGSYEHVPPMVKLGRFRKPDLHGAENVQMTEVRRQKSEDRGQRSEVRGQKTEDGGRGYCGFQAASFDL